MKKWTEFIDWAEGKGFCIGYKSIFITIEFGRKMFEEEVILFHEKKGLILYAVSFKGEVKSATLYGEVYMDDFPEIALNFISYERKKDNIVLFKVEYDLIKKVLDEILEKYVFSETWKYERKLDLVNYVERDGLWTEEDITAKKIILSSPEVKKIIYG